MSVQNYTGWPTNVNKIILDATTITVGENALRTDELENGMKRSIQKGCYVSDKYSVTMDFDWITVGSDGKTEYQRFLEWYKYVHKNGSVPFEFPSIIYSPQTGVEYVDDNNSFNKVEYYKITSEIQGSKYGESVRVTMTWESVYFGTVNISSTAPVFDRVQNCKQISLDVVFTGEFSISPVSSQFTLLADSINLANSANIEISGFYFNGNIARIFMKH